jgi:hypothetical protein
LGLPEQFVANRLVDAAGKKFRQALCPILGQLEGKSGIDINVPCIRQGIPRLAVQAKTFLLDSDCKRIVRAG